MLCNEKYAAKDFYRGLPGRQACKDPPTIEEEWIKAEVAKAVCGKDYEEVVREKIDRVLVGKDGELKILLKD